jgi:hypothetical protein
MVCSGFSVTTSKVPVSAFAAIITLAKIPNYKHQIPDNLQTPIFETLNRLFLLFWKLAPWDLFAIWDLIPCFAGWEFYFGIWILGFV